MSTETTQSLSELAEINPRVDLNGVPGDTLVSFIPMSDVSDSGLWVGRQERRLDEVRVGYTPFVENDILFAKITPCMENGKGAHATGLKNGIGFGSTEFHVLRGRGGNDSRFLFHWLQARATRTRAIAYMGGSAGQQRVQADFFFHFRIPRIDPREQSRIAAVLDTIDEAIARTEAVIGKLKQVRAGLLHDLLTRGLDEHGQLRDPIAHPEQFQDSPLGRIPRGWELVDLSHFVAGLDAGVSVNSDDRPHGSGEIGILKTSALSDGRFNPSENKTVVPRERWRVQVSPNADSILVSRMNTPELVGESAYVPNDEPTFFLPDRIWQLRFHDRSRLSVRWLAYVLGSVTARRYISLHATGTSGSMKNISKSQLLAFPIAKPPYEEQAQIAEYMVVADEQLETGRAQVEKLKGLKAGLMTDLLTGRVRVPENIMDGEGHT